MTGIPKPNLERRVIPLKAIFLRVLSGAAGVAAIVAGTVLPVLFAVAADEAWELIPALGFAGLCGFVAYRLIRFATKGPKPS
jgi:hypothetical protein